MIRLVLALFLAAGFFVDARAEDFLTRLRKSNVGGATVTVTQSEEIDALVNGTASASTGVKVSSTSTAASKGGSSAKTAAGTAVTYAAESPVAAADTVATVDAYVSGQKKVMRDGRKVTGYRVQVFSGGKTRDDKNKAYEVGSLIKSAFPEQPIYVHFYSPKWKCLLGNFRSYGDAEALLKEVKQLGYSQACIVKGKITVQD